MADTASSDGLAVIELPVLGMDCADCVTAVRSAIADLPGVTSVEVYLAAEKASVTLDRSRVGAESVRQAIERAGYRSPAPSRDPSSTAGAAAEADQAGRLGRMALTLLGTLFSVVLFAVVVGEGLGLFAAVTHRVPWWVGALLALALGWPVWMNVVRNALRGRIVSHTLMSMGALAALAVGQWPTAVLVVFFMRVGDYAEHLTTARARRSLKDLAALAPPTARLEREGQEITVPAEEVEVGDVVIVRPGEAIPVDGTVLAGRASVDQATITGESAPLDAEPGAQVFAATLAQLGSLRVRAERVGPDTTFGQTVRLVQEAEANRGRTQGVADRFATWYLPVVAAIALATFLLRGDLLAAVAVAVVACSCAFALATPVAMLASIGAAAKRGLLIRGGLVIEALARADTVLLDKTGTLTEGEPELTDVLPLGILDESEVLRLAAAAERDSEHPLAGAVKRAATRRGLTANVPDTFEAAPGLGVHASVDGRTVSVGSIRMLDGAEPPDAARALQAQGKTLLYVLLDGAAVGILATRDAPRAGAPAALTHLRALGIQNVEVLTGDQPATALALARDLGITAHAGLLPRDKVDAIERYQARGHTVIMLGDGVNDAPALARADVGVAMGAAGSPVALEAAHAALMTDDLEGLPELIRTARRTMRVVRFNIGFTIVYNVVGLTLAALGLLPPIYAAALQSLPDLGIMANSARLLRPPRGAPIQPRRRGGPQSAAAAS
ncbi:MAG TPA: cation-translocating P-type ATPase [Trueperaceae bacterium]|nr:cation-translocating P-type ATPase [Trueperaceae bacterium]